MKAARKAASDPWELLHGSVDRTNRVLQLVEGFMPEAGWLDDGETLTYLHSTISTRQQRVRVPETPMHLDALLADEPLAGGLEPRLGSHHLRTLTVVGFPTQTHPGILDELNRLAFPYRWSTRAILLDKTEAVKLLTKIRRQWFAKRKSIAAIVKEVMTNEASTLVDSDAANKAADADLALQELGADDIGQAYITASVTVWDEDAGLAAEKARLVEKVIQGRDCTCMPEGVNALEAWLGSIPGHAYANVRQPPISTLNLAHMIPLSAVWAGPTCDEHFKAPPLFFDKTEGSTPFRFSLHVGDVGHCLIVGPTGAGKSVLLALMAMQFRRYRDNQIFAFDFGGSIRTAALAFCAAIIDSRTTPPRVIGEPWPRRLHIRLAHRSRPPLGRRSPSCPDQPGDIVMIKLRHLAAASAAVLSLAFVAPPASAQWIVYDPTNFGQNVLTAARELQQINNQIQMLTNQATSLVNQARNLASLPMSTLTQLQSSIAQTRSLLSQAQNIAFNVQRVEQAFSTNYGASVGAGSTAAMVANAQTRW